MMATNRTAGQIAASMNTASKALGSKSEKNVIKSCTDITGFGLIGHLIEMVKASRKSTASRNCCAEINLQRVNFLRGGFKAARKSVFSSLQPDNYKQRGGVANHDEILNNANPNLIMKYNLLYNPETSGGLLFFVAPQFVDDFVARLSSAGVDCCEIGDLVPVTGDHGEYCQAVEDGEKIRKGGKFVHIRT